MSEWHYSVNGRQFGPVTLDQMKQLVADGRLSAADLVWREGMKEWAAAGSLTDVFVQIHQQSDAQTQAPVAQIGYYNPSSGLSDRVRRTLSGFPPPTGMQGEWPLSDANLTQLKEAEKHRKALRGFNSLCQLFTLIGALYTLGTVIVFLDAMSGGLARRSILGASSAATAAIILLIGLSITVSCFMAGKAALKCRLWGPITIVAFLTIGTLWFLVGIFAAASSRGGVEEVAIPVVIVLLFVFAFFYVTVRGLTAIPKFLAAPVWAQEALVNAKL